MAALGNVETQQEDLQDLVGLLGKGGRCQKQ